MSHQIHLTMLTSREAITDALYRAILGIDTHDSKIFDSAWISTPDASFDLNGTVSTGLEAIRKNVLDVVGPLDTTHILSNIRIDVKDGANTASLSANAIAQHYRAGTGNVSGAVRLLAGSLYDIDVVKDEGDGLWKVKKWVLKLIWSEGDFSVMAKP